MVSVLVNSARVRVLTEDGQTLPVQLSAQWSSAVQMDGEVYQVCVHVSTVNEPTADIFPETLESVHTWMLKCSLEDLITSGQK